VTDYTILSNTAVGVGGLPSGATVTALRDNPIAIAEGAVGAPKIQAAALDITTAERDWVLARITEASVGSVGTYALLKSAGFADISPGGTTAGSGLRYSTAGGTIQAPFTAPSGTWRCMGFVDISGANPDDTTVFLRIA